ncbi:WG repeat-containing protein [Pseudoflavitalea rhizosphaerae]|uniref:WG repeat-containing protein n=1 Tax=Pseudoflavitalea rhizosphaerae TaxID=1884793 RepID=UPI000F8D0305
MKYKGKFGFINSKAEVIIPFQYDEAADFEFGRVRVIQNGRTYYFNKQGRKL